MDKTELPTTKDIEELIEHISKQIDLVIAEMPNLDEYDQAAAANALFNALDSMNYLADSVERAKREGRIGPYH